jgi:PrtD family type I secretion system ABC transporter
MAKQKTVESGQTVLEAALKECRSAFWAAALFSFIINILVLAIPLYMLQVMDRVLRSGSVETLLLLTVIAIAAVFVMSILDTLRNSIAMRTGSWFNDKLAPMFLETSCRAQIRGDHAGTEMLRDLSYLQGFIATQGMAAFFDSPWLPIFVVFIWQLHPYLGMVALGSALLLLAISFITEWLTHAPSVKAEETQIEAMRLADATIRNAEVVHAMGMMPAMTDRWRQLNDLVTRSIHFAGDVSGYMLTVSKFVRSAVQIAILGVGAWLVVENHITPGGMIAAAILLGRALAPIEMAIGGWKGFIAARLAYDRLNDHAKTYPPVPERTRLPVPTGQLTVENLTFAVPESGNVILNDITFNAEPGEVLAIVGPSGAGKSTLCRLLVGLNEQVAGEIRLDGNDLRHWDRLQLGELVGFLPQEVELFSGTIRENIARMGEARDDEVFAAAELAHVHALIQRLPHGYDTEIGDGGVRLSGGQRQRIGLARAVFRTPRLVVLDEPNSNLDQAGESSLAKTLRDLKARGSTVIVVGHRPSTLSEADKILVMQDGSAVMFGDRDDVLEAWSKASAGFGSTDILALHRASAQPTGAKAIECSLEAGAL